MPPRKPRRPESPTDPITGPDERLRARGGSSWGQAEAEPETPRAAADEALAAALAPSPDDAPPDDDAPPLPDDVDPLAKRHDERKEWHRALLLWAMQDAEARNLSVVARALGRDESSLRYWMRRKEWERRVQHAGAGGQSRAVAMYREQYLAAGAANRIEIEAIRDLVSIPMFPDESPAAPTGRGPLPESVTEGRHDARLSPGATAGEPATQGAPPAAVQKDKPSERPRVKEIRKNILILDAALSKFAAAVVGDKIKISARDAPYLMSYRARLATDLEREEAGGGVSVAGAVEVPESFRVKLARSNGGDVIEAVAEDARDLFLAMRAITNQRDTDIDVAARLAPSVSTGNG